MPTFANQLKSEISRLANKFGFAAILGGWAGGQPPAQIALSELHQ